MLESHIKSKKIFRTESPLETRSVDRAEADAAAEWSSKYSRTEPPSWDPGITDAITGVCEDHCGV